MSSPPPLPPAGYLLQRIYNVSQSYALLPVDTVPEGDENERDVAFNWDWRFIEDDVFQVIVALAIRGRQPQPEEAKVVTIGEFAIAEGGEPDNLPLRDFVTGNAPAMLFPYARQAIANLTGAGPFGAYHLPPVNVRGLMKGEKYEESTGAAQLTAAEADDNPMTALEPGEES